MMTTTLGGCCASIILFFKTTYQYADAEPGASNLDIFLPVSSDSRLISIPSDNVESPIKTMLGCSSSILEMYNFLTSRSNCGPGFLGNSIANHSGIFSHEMPISRKSMNRYRRRGRMLLRIES